MCPRLCDDRAPLLEEVTSMSPGIGLSRFESCSVALNNLLSLSGPLLPRVNHKPKEFLPHRAI